MSLFTTYFLTSIISGSVKMMCHFLCAFIIAACFNVVLTADDITAEDYQDQNTKGRPVGRAYSLTSCDYKTQVGYSCLTCNRALHCYPGNAAILVDCYGLFRFCRDGRCSRHEGEKCLTDIKITTPEPSPAIASEVTENVVPASSEATTRSETGSATESVPDTAKENLATSIVTETVTTTFVTEDVATTLTNNVSESDTTETVIIPIDATVTTEEVSSTNAVVNTSSNVV